MLPEILAILGMTGTVLVAIWTMGRSLRAGLTAEIKATRIEVREEIQGLGDEIKDLREDQLMLNARMSGLERLLQGLKEAIVARAVA